MRSVPGTGSSCKSPSIVGNVGLIQYTSSAVSIVFDAAGAVLLKLPSPLDMEEDNKEGTRPSSADSHILGRITSSPTRKIVFLMRLLASKVTVLAGTEPGKLPLKPEG